MIAYLKGKIIDVNSSYQVVINVNNVGYLVNHVRNDFLIDQEVEIRVYTAVRENEISLWGFESAKQLEMFELLLSVTGIGLRTAHVLIRNLGIEQIVGAIASGQPQSLKAPGVGSKLTERLVLELRSKISDFGVGESALSAEGNAVNPNTQYESEATTALTQLGYSQAEIIEALKQLRSNSYNNASELVKDALKYI